MASQGNLSGTPPNNETSTSGKGSQQPTSSVTSAQSRKTANSVSNPSKQTLGKPGQSTFVSPSKNLGSANVGAAGLPQPPNFFQSSTIPNPYTLPSHPRLVSRPAPVLVTAATTSSHINSIFSVIKPTSMVKSTAGFDRNRTLRAQVERAIREHKIFACVGVYPAVRKALHKRGWVEKNPSLGIVRSVNLGNTNKELEKGYDTDESDQMWMNRVLRDYPADLIWVIRRDNVDWRGLHKDQIINRFPKAFFTTKVGIAACLQNMQWFSESGVADTFFPRCYRLCIEEEKASFIDDYRLSACMGLLKWVVQAYERDGEAGVMDRTSRVVSLAVDFAVRQVNNYVRMRRHEDIDWLMPPAFMGQHWDVFLNQYYNVVLMHSKLAPNDSQDTAKLKYDASKRALQRISQFWPQLQIDGMNNMWICKPGARSRGKGIVIMNHLEKILDLLSQSNCREANWVVQKYIERPLIIYKTKFDIRQWFIVTDWSPLTIWFYRESYVRFCSKPFSLDDFHESIHLCNNAIQCRYQNSEARDSALPDENMWDCYTFQTYLKSIGKGAMWESIIYPGMKQGIVGVLLASQETHEAHKNCFELYGADYMLSEDLRPWLIEINSCPCMAPSTSVTARMCAQCLDDAIKVVVDRREDKMADTGLFELIFKQTQTANPVPFNGVDLIVQGKRLNKDVDWPSIMTKYNTKPLVAPTTSRSGRVSHVPSAVDNGLTFLDLVHRLRLKEAQLSITAEIHGPSKTNLPSTTESGHSQSVEQKSILGDKPKSTPSSNNNVVDDKQDDENKSNGKKVRRKSPSSKVTIKTRSSRRVKHPPAKAPSGLRPSNTETLLSTLLKHSTPEQPTMADLIRISHATAQQTIHRARMSTYGQPNPDVLTEHNDNLNKGALRFLSKSQLANKSRTSTPLQARGGLGNGSSAGKIRPNANLTPPVPVHNVPQSVLSATNSEAQNKFKGSSGSKTW